jgi:hypothetical protein
LFEYSFLEKENEAAQREWFDEETDEEEEVDGEDENKSERSDTESLYDLDDELVFGFENFM